MQQKSSATFTFIIFFIMESSVYSQIQYNLEGPYPHENYLYHYTSYPAALNILCCKSLRLGQLTTMNDPLEFENHKRDPIAFHGDISNEETSKTMNSFSEGVKRRNRCVRLMSFSIDYRQTIDDAYNRLTRGWARTRMWAQYADNHKGVCLVFDKSKLIDSFSNTFPKKTKCCKITYSNNFEDLKEAWESPCLLNNQTNRDFSNFWFESKKLKFFFQKCKDFRDEQEFRFLLVNGDLKYDDIVISFPFKDALKGIILGDRFKSEDRTTMENVANDIPIFRIWWHLGEPELLASPKFSVR